MRSCLIALTVALVACGDATGSGGSNTPTTDGSWKATIAGSNGSGTMALTLTHTGTGISGSGTFTDADPPPAILSVVGTIDGTSVTLILVVQPQQFMGNTIDQNQATLTFTGTLAATTLNGTLNGGSPPLFGVTANFTKQ